ncbi:MAG: phosphate acyltransferase PlsX [Chloroflexi bacterium]|nr:phosphate acyltransferase PlsX [Chloroflexota bacterium]
MPVRVALDAMGGDFAPGETVRGAMQAAGADLEVILFGDADHIERERASLPVNPSVSVVHTSQVVEMHAHPVEAFRRMPDSSLRRAVEAVKSGQASAMVSAGNTGAVMAAAKLTLGGVEGVDRPAIAAMLPTTCGRSLLIDAGANVDCTPLNLYQFALMGSIYIRAIWKKDVPSVGLINIGEEPGKGNALSKQAYDLLSESCPGFAGNIEPREFFVGKVDVAVCDGFVGNILLKAGEGVAEMIGNSLMQLSGELGAEVVQKALHRLRDKMDYAVYGGAPLLGVNGACFIAHGRSKAMAISNALGVAAEAVNGGMVEQIRERVGHAAMRPGELQGS